MPQSISIDEWEKRYGKAPEQRYSVPFKEGARPATKEEFDRYQARVDDPAFQALDAGMAGAGALALSGGAAAAGLPGAGVMPFVTRAATNPLVIGGGRAVAGLATGESLPGALLEGGQAAAYAKLGKVAAGRVAAPATAAAPAVAKVAASEVSDNRAALMKFGAAAAARNPKLGEKIWILLDKNRMPVATLTPGEAGAAARAGKETTWIKNLWQAAR